VTMHNFGVCER